MGPTDGSASKEEKMEDKKKGNGNQMISSSMGHTPHLDYGDGIVGPHKWLIV